MAAAPAAEAPVLAYLVVGLLALLMWGVCLGLRGAWDHTFGVMLRLMADALNFDKYFVHIHLGGAFTAIDHRVQNALVKSAQKFQHTAGYFFHGVAVIQGWIARELVGLASDTLAWATWLQHSHLPKWVKALIYTLVPPLIIPRVLTALKHLKYGHWITRVRIIEKHLPVQVIRVLKAAGAVALPGTLGIPKIWQGIRDLRKWRSTVNARLRSLEKYAGASAAVALFTAALAKLGLKWIRCRNVTKVGRAVCRTDTSLLDLLLLDTLPIIGAVSVVSFTKELRAIESNVLSIMGRIVTEFPKG